MLNTAQLTDLKMHLAHCTGSETLYRHTLFRRILYSAGVQYLAETAGAYWLLDEIAIAQSRPKMKHEEFQVWTLKVANSAGVLTCTDGNYNQLFSKRVRFTDFPLPKITLYFENSTICLPAER